MPPSLETEKGPPSSACAALRSHQADAHVSCASAGDELATLLPLKAPPQYLPHLTMAVAELTYASLLPSSSHKPPERKAPPCAGHSSRLHSAWHTGWSL